MHWEKALLELFDDLETRAAGLAHQAREVDVADLARAEYAEVTLTERLHGSVGTVVRLETNGSVPVSGLLERVGQGCVAVAASEAPRGLHLVNLDHVLSVTTGSSRAASSTALPVTSRLGFASAVRHLADEVDEVALQLCDARRLTGRLVRVGADFLELVPEHRPDVVLVPLAAVVTLASG